MNNTNCRKRLPSSGKIWHHGIFSFIFTAKSNIMTIWLFLLSTTRIHQSTVHRFIPKTVEFCDFFENFASENVCGLFSSKRGDLSHISISLPSFFALHFSAFFWCVPSRSGLGTIKSVFVPHRNIKISSKANRLCKWITAFTLIENTIQFWVRFDDDLLCDGRACAHTCVRAPAVLRRCNQFWAR